MGQQVFIKCEGNLEKELESNVFSNKVFNKIPEAQRSNDDQIDGVISGGSNS